MKRSPVSTHRLSAVVFVACAFVAGACATTSERVRQSEADSPAELLFDRGMRKLEANNYRGAIDSFSQLRNNFPYSRYAVRADLRIADAYYEQGQYATAVGQYRTFVKLHPKHPKVAYARFRIGSAEFEQMPNNWFFLPPAHERDLTSTRKAVQALQNFVERHPESKHVKKGRELLSRARRRLANHEMYVARFYLERNNPEGATQRLKYLLNNYSSLGLDAQALFMLAKAYVRQKNKKGARTAIRDLLKHHPDSEYTARARRYAKRHDLGVGGS